MNGMAASPEIPVAPDLWPLLLKSFGMLAIVLALLGCLFWVVKRLASGRRDAQGKNLMTMLASFYVAPREKIVLMDVMGRKILIGVTQNTITCLAVIDEKGGASPAGEEAPGFFEGVFREKMKNGAGRESDRDTKASGGNKFTENGGDEEK